MSWRAIAAASMWSFTAGFIVRGVLEWDAYRTDPHGRPPAIPHVVRPNRNRRHRP